MCEVGVIDTRCYFLVVRQLKSAVEYQQVVEKLGIENQRNCLGYRIAVKALERIAGHIENIAKSYILLSEVQKDSPLGNFVALNSSVIAVFEKSVGSLFARDHAMAEKILQEIKEVRKSHSDISNELFHPKDIQSAILQKTMLDSLGRIASYSGDIAEIAINMSAGALSFEDWSLSERTQRPLHNEGTDYIFIVYCFYFNLKTTWIS